MKKSHKREIFMARLIFGAFVLLVVLLVVAVILIVSSISGNGSDTEKNKPAGGTVSEQITPGTEQVPEEPSTEGTESSENDPNPDNTVDNSSKRWIKGDSVNFRAEPNTDCEILGSFAAGTEVEYISEANGWAKITYNGREGYVKTDFLTDVQP